MANKKAKPKEKRKQADEKSARIKKARQVKKLLTWTILLAITIGLIIFLCNSEMFKVCKIEVVGNSQVSQETIIKLSDIKLGNNIFLTNTIKAKSRINQNAYMKDITIKRELPDKIKIEIVEKQKVYILQVENQYAYIDKSGSILEISNAKLDTLIKLEGYTTAKEEIQAGKVLNEKDLESLQEVQKILKSSEKIELQNKISTINIKSKNDYILTVPEYKKIIYLGDTGNLANKMLYTKAILEESGAKEGKIFLNGNFNEGFNPYFREELNSQ